jgi:hypothetical protein
MRRLVVTQNITLDGSIEMLDDWFDPQGQGDQSDLTEELHRPDSEADGFLVGPKDSHRPAYWPQQTNDTTSVTNYLNHVRKYVVTSTLTEPEWEPTTILSGDPIAEVAALKHTDGKDIVCAGSILLTHTLIQAGLVDA